MHYRTANDGTRTDPSVEPMSTPRGDSATASAYDVVAASYARALPDDGYEAPLDRAMIADFAELVGLSAGRRVVDAGSGAWRTAGGLRGTQARPSPWWVHCCWAFTQDVESELSEGPTGTPST